MAANRQADGDPILILDGNEFKLNVNQIGSGGNGVVHALYPVGNEDIPLVVKFPYQIAIKDYRIQVADDLNRVKKPAKRTLYISNDGYYLYTGAEGESYRGKLPPKLLTNCDLNTAQGQALVKNFLWDRDSTALYEQCRKEAEIQSKYFETHVYRLESGSVAILMPRIPGKPIHDLDLSKHSLSQKFEAAALLAQTSLEFSAKRISRIHGHDGQTEHTDSKSHNILLESQFDENGNVVYQCNNIDFSDRGRSFHTAAPEWNRNSAKCDLFLVKEFNANMRGKLNIQGNAIILDNNNEAHFILNGKLCLETLTDVNREGLELCKDPIQKSTGPKASRVIAALAKKTNLPLGNHDDAMEVYSLTSSIAMLLGETDVSRYKLSSSNLNISDPRERCIAMQNANFYLEGMKENIRQKAIKIGLVDNMGNLRAEIIDAINLLEAMQHRDPEQRPEKLEIVRVLNTAALLCREAEMTQKDRDSLSKEVARPATKSIRQPIIPLNHHLLSERETIQRIALRIDSPTGKFIFNKAKELSSFDSKTVQAARETISEEINKAIQRRKERMFGFFYTNNTPLYQQILKSIQNEAPKTAPNP